MKLADDLKDMGCCGKFPSKQGNSHGHDAYSCETGFHFIYIT